MVWLATSPTPHKSMQSVMRLRRRARGTPFRWARKERYSDVRISG